MPMELPPLPYADDALEPYTSARTLSFHHGKHHRAYVDNLNRLIAGSALESQTLEAVVLETAGDPARAGIFNNAAQVWNHTFFWSCMRPNGGGAPPAELAARLEADFGGVQAFSEALKTAAIGRFGSGWAWLVEEGGRLKVTSTPNAETPITAGLRPVLTVDVWEHAYYLDYQNRRPDFVQAFLDHLVNWEFAVSNLAGG
ncbi:MAG TPA: superoxide dismutase [Chthonomonadales bacterium]|nr:superoxide dismutase [Chthonomonadales bacterium]